MAILHGSLELGVFTQLTIVATLRLGSTILILLARHWLCLVEWIHRDREKLGEGKLDSPKGPERQFMHMA